MKYEASDDWFEASEALLDAPLVGLEGNEAWFEASESWFEASEALFGAPVAVLEAYEA